MNELSALRTETSKTFELDPKSGAGQYQLEARTGPIHYKETYAAEDPWLDIDVDYCEESELKDIGKVLVYSRAPNIVTVFQDVCGYQIQSRSNRDHIARVELVSIDGQEVKAWQDNADLVTSVRIHPRRIGLWKEFRKARADYVRIKWKVTESGKAGKSEHEFAFRETPEAYNTANLSSLSPLSRESAKVTVSAFRERIDDNSWYWTEVIPKTAVLVDTDYQVGASARDCLVYWNGSAWVMAALTHVYNVVGYESASAYKIGSGLGFASVDIPAAATIIGATLTCRASGNWANAASSRITGHKVSDSGVFTGLADFQGRRGTIVGGADNDEITSAQVDWDPTAYWYDNTDYTSPEIKTIIQEMLPVSGGLTLFWDDFDDRSTHTNGREKCVYSYDGASANAPKLTVTWSLKKPYWYYNMMKGQ